MVLFEWAKKKSTNFETNPQKNIEKGRKISKKMILFLTLNWSISFKPSNLE